MFAMTALIAGAFDVGIVFYLNQVDVGLDLAKGFGILFSALVRWVSYRQILFSVVRKELGKKIERDPAPGDFRLSVVLPAFNEGKRISSSIEAIVSELGRLNKSEYEIIVVDDGSTDDTVKQAENCGAVVVQMESNSGKGAAVRQGILAANGKSVVFTDADLAYDPKIIVLILNELEQGWDIVVGNRRLDDSKAKVKAKLLRRVGGWGVNRLTHLVLLGRFRDTQCGIKGFRSDIGKSIAQRLRIDGFGFDVEIFLMAEQDDMSLKEVPVFLKNREGSSVSLFADTYKLLQDLVRVRRWAGKGFYLPEAQTAQNSLVKADN